MKASKMLATGPPLGHLAATPRFHGLLTIVFEAFHAHISNMSDGPFQPHHLVSMTWSILDPCPRCRCPSGTEPTPASLLGKPLSWGPWYLTRCEVRYMGLVSVGQG